MDKKKKIERDQFEKFISNEKLRLPVYNIEDSETPDFITNINKKIVSVEHSRLINPMFQKIEQHKEKIIKNAQKKFEQKYTDKLYTLITFDDAPLKPGRHEEEKYTDEVFHLIEQIYLANRSFEFTVSSSSHQVKVSPSIESFSVNNIDNFSHWQHFGAYSVNRIDMNWLQSIISKKDKNIDKYLQKFDENWLLLVSDFGTEASTNDFVDIDFSIIKSRFDKIYIYSYMMDQVITVK
ncbi:hypothetical protein [Elizabethkingia occulta]|uniref:hypothetical protein n=1 Tax=Elizabethkingia occulta TaxID=1867263 RepID=UPI00099A4F25|nr:hypothetical protein [Elizabethkingia occulta]OPB97917.1 hypothetical protein BB020_13915 [Elizabethkingia occulta]